MRRWGELGILENGALRPWGSCLPSRRAIPAPVTPWVQRAGRFQVRGAAGQGLGPLSAGSGGKWPRGQAGGVLALSLAKPCRRVSLFSSGNWASRWSRRWRGFGAHEGSEGTLSPLLVAAAPKMRVLRSWTGQWSRAACC